VQAGLEGPHHGRKSLLARFVHRGWGYQQEKRQVASSSDKPDTDRPSQTLEHRWHRRCSYGGKFTGEFLTASPSNDADASHCGSFAAKVVELAPNTAL
jgi:hypothetical protein